MDTKEVSLTMELIKEGLSAPPFPWVDLIRSHCETLAEMDPDLVSAISITTRLKGDSADEVSALHLLSRLIAEEFGFTATLRVNGPSLSVRFARRTAELLSVGPSAARKERRG